MPNPYDYDAMCVSHSEAEPPTVANWQPGVYFTLKRNTGSDAAARLKNKKDGEHLWNMT